MLAPVPIAVVGAALALTACSPDFDPYTRLSTLRVLAVQSEPVTPAPGESTELRALVYAPPGEVVTEQRWSWCPFEADGGAPCPISEAELRAYAGADADAIPPYDLGTGETATFPHTIPSRLLDALCTGSADQPQLVDCTGGFPAQIRVTVRTATAEIATVRRLQLRRDGDVAPSTNPVIDDLSSVSGDDQRSLTEAADVEVPRAVETPLRVAVAPEMAETYPDVDASDQPVQKRERLIFTWFVESGDTSADRTTFIDGIEPLEDALEVDWEPAESADYPRDTARVIVVLRDDREGVSWRSGVARLGGAP